MVGTSEYKIKLKKMDNKLSNKTVQSYFVKLMSKLYVRIIMKNNTLRRDFFYYWLNSTGKFLSSLYTNCSVKYTFHSLFVITIFHDCNFFRK